MRLPTDEEIKNWNPHGYTPDVSLMVHAKNGDHRGARLVVATVGPDEVYRDKLVVDRAWERAKFIEGLAAALGCEASALANLDLEIVRHANTADEQEDEPTAFPIAFGDLLRQHLRLQPTIIDGLLRRGETANIIAAPKVGKSWLAYGLALSVATGGRWLDSFDCLPGRVLLIDNELHPATLAHRIPAVADAMSIRAADYQDSIDVMPLRGQLLDLRGIDRTLERIEAGVYDVVVLDAWYRAMPADTSENDNAKVAQLYNAIDGMAGRLNCCWVNIHHASKGSQGDKLVTDVGAGAGSQSRAADCHIVLRQHEDDGVVVFEAVVRSFPPVDPLALRWSLPVWKPDFEADPSKLRGRQTLGEQRQQAKDKAGIDAIIDELRKGEPLPTKRIKATLGAGLDRTERLLAMLEKDGHIKRLMRTVKGNECTFWSLNNDTQ